MKKLMSLLLTTCLLLTGCSTASSGTSNKGLENITTQSFLANYKEYLQYTLQKSSFTEDLSIKYDITSQDLPNYKIYDNIEIKAAKDTAVSSIRMHHYEHESVNSDVTITRINNDGETFCRYQTGAEDLMLKVKEGLNEAYIDSISGNQLFNFESAKFSEIKWEPTSNSTMSGSSGRYILVYDSQFINDYFKEELDNIMFLDTQNGEIKTDEAKVTIEIKDGTVQSTNIYCLGGYTEGNKIYNFIVSLDREFRDLGRTYPDTISKSEEELYEEVNKSELPMIGKTE